MVLSHFSICMTGRQEDLQPVKVGCWHVAGDDLTGALHVLQLQLSLLPPSSLAMIKYRMPTFWYRLPVVVRENGCSTSVVVAVVLLLITGLLHFEN